MLDVESASIEFSLHTKQQTFSNSPNAISEQTTAVELAVSDIVRDAMQQSVDAFPCVFAEPKHHRKAQVRQPLVMMTHVTHPAVVSCEQIARRALLKIVDADPTANVCRLLNRVALTNPRGRCSCLIIRAWLLVAKLSKIIANGKRTCSQPAKLVRSIDRTSQSECLLTFRFFFFRF